ncbi:glycoside hydrolase family 15 protein [Thermobifida halotolerans]|uniref:Glycoside hydrolase family 15 protein n=1 Tax=Thermobifida halotolerans TaxID=483545 RepID=A0A399FWD9_9ACTN|nr:glycoside hydrolase family 15 protein [Thermobifida halotolerans]UOE19079.1 glycoside hydrolase family 15 protein [Thermobifida halotolerans]
MTAAEFPPIGEYALLSDCRTAALVAPDGAVEWLCVPRFDGPSVFARLLDRQRGGAWEMTVVGATAVERSYVEETLVLRTHWQTPEGVAVGYDFLATLPHDPEGVVSAGVLVRLVHCERGAVRVRSRVVARPDYGARDARWNPRDGALVEDGSGILLSGFGTTMPGVGGAVTTETTLRAGESLAVGLDYTGDTLRRITAETAHHLLDQSVRTWQTWSSDADYHGVAADRVRHSAVVLRGLMFEDTGGLIAAPTTSLPERVGGQRNWDYRYVWHRDAALVVLALLRMGHKEEAGQYLRFLLGYCVEKERRVPPMVGIGQTPVPDEKVLDHLSGYRNSRPVRIHNNAYDQHQLDVYGHILDAALAYQQVTGGLAEADLGELRKVVELACTTWTQPDAGVWEVRDGHRHWTNSKLYAWVCFDRAVRLFQKTGAVSDELLDTWRVERDAVRVDLLNKGCHPGLGRFVQSYGSANVDGSLLRIPLVGFLEGDDPRVLATIDRIDAELGDAGFLVHRYDTASTRDGIDDAPEGAFLLCSFEMVSALVLAGRTEEARRRFEALCSHAGPLGLFAEEMSADGTMLGNYPQAFTHLALIEAAMNLDEAGHEDALHAWARRHHTRSHR